MAVFNYAMSSALVILLVASTSFLVGRKSGELSTGAGFQPQRPPQSQLDVEPRAQLGTDPVGANSSERAAHIYFVLDRSGSMQSIRKDVIGGFNAFVEEQRAAPGQMRMTFLQFDSHNPREVVFAGRDIQDVPLLTPDTFKPRGSTPLYDALGFALAQAEQSHTDGERLVLVAFSDGQENDSRHHSREAIFARITEKRKLGWTFVFLGANQDAFAEGSRTGYGAGNTQNFQFDAQGTRTAFQSVSSAMSSMRLKMESGMSESIDSEDFFEGVKFAEDDYRKRSR